MAATDQRSISPLGAGAAAAALALSAEARWNQTEADWLLFLTAGTVFGMHDDDGRLIATAALLPYGDRQAWISMVLVTAAWQRQGLATRLLRACLDAAAARGLTSWLDATPAGAAVYGPMGFAPTGALQRLALPAGHAARGAAPRAGTLDDLLLHDRRAMGFDRGAVLSALAGRPGSRIVAADGAITMIRDGRHARHIGPVHADSVVAAAALIAAIAGCEQAPLLLDATDDHRGLITELTTAGWTAQRPFTRMRFGTGAALPTAPGLAVAGPEFG